MTKDSIVLRQVNHVQTARVLLVTTAVVDQKRPTKLSLHQDSTPRRVRQNHNLVSRASLIHGRNKASVKRVRLAITAQRIK